MTLVENHQPLLSFLEADFWAELAQVKAESIGLISLDVGAYLHLGFNEHLDSTVIEVDDLPKPEMQDTRVLWRDRWVSK